MSNLVLRLRTGKRNSMIIGDGELLMRKTKDQITSNSILLVHEADRESLENYLNVRIPSIDEDDFPGYFSFDYNPYLYAILDRETFYRYAAIDWLYKFEEGEDRLIIGEDAFHYEEALYLSKSDGCVYYENFTNQSIKVASSLWEIWNFLLDKYPDVREEMEMMKIGQRRVESLDENSFSKVVQYASSDQEEKVQSILRILGELSVRSQSKDEEERPGVILIRGSFFELANAPCDVPSVISNGSSNSQYPLRSLPCPSHFIKRSLYRGTPTVKLTENRIQFYK